MQQFYPGDLLRLCRDAYIFERCEDITIHTISRHFCKGDLFFCVATRSYKDMSKHSRIDDLVLLDMNNKFSGILCNYGLSTLFEIVK